MESYIVKFNYKKDDGYWVYGAEVEVSVEGKSSHVQAANLVKDMYPNCTAVTVAFV